MSNNDNVDGLCANLRHIDRCLEDEPYWVIMVATKAAAALERQAAEMERLQEVVDELIKLDTGPKIRLRRNGTTDIRIEALTGED